LQIESNTETHRETARERERVKKQQQKMKMLFPDGTYNAVLISPTCPSWKNFSLRVYLSSANGCKWV
jgi:hypothetical protein